MSEYATIPDGWTEAKYEVEQGESGEEFDALWASTDEKIAVTAMKSTDADGTDTYPVVVEQTLESDEGHTITVQSHALVEDSRKHAERIASEFMHEVNDGMHALHLLGVESDESGEFYQFYCLSDSELPDGMTADQLMDSIDTEQHDDQIEELPDDFDPEKHIEEAIQVDIFIRHEAEVGPTDDTN